MKITITEIENILLTLDQTPKGLARLASRADASRLRFKPDARSWSAADVLAHLRACADVWTASIVFMLNRDEPILPDLHPGNWLKQTNYPALLFADSLTAFTKQRRNLLDVLLESTQADWERGAYIGGQRYTVFGQARRMAKHEAGHLAHVEKLLIE
jgi:hypothetical protein